MTSNFIAADTSSLVSFFKNETGKDVEIINQCFLNENLVIPAIVLTEILSDPKLPAYFKPALFNIPFLEIKENTWKRAGENRALLIKNKFKARLGDALISQICIDNNVILITRDADFRHFAKHCGLKLAT